MAEAMVPLILLTALCTGQVPEAWREVRESPEHLRHLDAGVKCGSCHAGSFDPAGTAPCESCHFQARTPLHLGAFEGEPRCADCHRFGANPAIEPWNCARCHTSDPMKPSAHSAQNCATCHSAHGAREKVECATCHKDQVPGREKHTCETCHSPHAPKEKAISDCASCHQEEKKHVECVSCHEPHTSRTNNCTQCHAQKVASPKHDNCSNCHIPHRVEPELALGSCVKCHEKIEVVHTQNAAEDGSCGSCHVSHGVKKKPPVVAPCSSCHQAAKNDLAFHNGKTKCASCHQAHDFLAPLERAEHFGQAATCATCHKDQVSSPISEHRDCVACHAGGAHRPEPLPSGDSCERCHEKVAATAPEGHADCNSCHEPHSGKMRAKLACATCHSEQVQTKHGHTPNGCADCHRPHGPGGIAEPPKCSTCHVTSELPGLHLAGGHQQCSSCHGAHDRALPLTRAACTTCHIDQVTHQPEAPICSSCHPFAGRTDR
jgi:hypothetical protein